MRKMLSLVLCLMMIICCIPALAEDAAPVKTGLSFVTTTTTARGGGIQANLVLAAVNVDDNGVITACVFDYVQAAIAFDENGKLTTDINTEFLSKNEKGDAYGMRKASSINAEWNEQAAAFAAYCVGKTLEEVKAMPLNDAGKGIDVIASCTLAASEFLPGLEDAVNNAVHMGAKKGDELKLTQVSNMSKSKDATETAEGQAQVYSHVGVFTLNGDVITSCYIDAVQATVKFDAKGQITSDMNAAILTKNEKGDAYGMRNASSIKAEWNEQTAAFCQFVTGKTLEEATKVAAAPADTDVIASCTIGTSDFQQLLVKAAQ